MSQIPEVPKPAGEPQQFQRLFLTVLLILVFIMAARTPLDSDMWWHLRAGEITWTTGHPMLVDSLSYTRSGVQWINHSWLSQVLMYAAFHWGGYLGLSALVAVLAVVSMFLLYVQMNSPMGVRALIIVLTAVIASLVWSPRPQMISLTLFSGVLYVLYLYKWKRRNFLWLLVPMFILWSNVHGGYVLGLLLVGTMLGGEVLNHVMGYRSDADLSYRSIIQLGVWAILSGLAVVINPNGMLMWLIPFRTVGVQTLQNLVAEWASPDFHQLILQPYLWMLFLVIFCMSISGKRVDCSDLLPVMLFGYLGLVSQRNFGPFALTAAPILDRSWLDALDTVKQANSMMTERVQAWWSRLGLSGRGQKPLSSQLQKTINLTLVFFLGLAAAGKLYVVSQPALVGMYESRLFPVGAVAWIKANQPPLNLFNSYAWGGYLTWNLRDDPVFVDGRTDLFNDEIIGDWLRVIRADAGWQLVVDHWQIKTILVESGSAITRVLPQNGWKLVYSDDLAVVYTR